MIRQENPFQRFLQFLTQNPISLPMMESMVLNCGSMTTVFHGPCSYRQSSTGPSSCHQKLTVGMTVPEILNSQDLPLFRNQFSGFFWSQTKGVGNLSPALLLLGGHLQNIHRFFLWFSISFEKIYKGYLATVCPFFS